MNANDLHGAPDMGTLRHQVAFDLTDQDFIANPYPRYRQLREDPALWRDENGLLALTRYDDVAAVLRDQRWSSDPSHMSPERAAPGAAWVGWGPSETAG